MDVNGDDSKRVPRFCEAKLHDKFSVRCVSNYAVSVREPYQGCGRNPANGGNLRLYAMAIPCQASKEEGVTTIGSSPSTLSIDTAVEVRTTLSKG
jgi:hypothetical protein